MGASLLSIRCPIPPLSLAFQRKKRPLPRSCPVPQTLWKCSWRFAAAVYISTPRFDLLKPCDLPLGLSLTRALTVPSLGPTLLLSSRHPPQLVHSIRYECDTLSFSFHLYQFPDTTRFELQFPLLLPSKLHPPALKHASCTLKDGDQARLRQLARSRGSQPARHRCAEPRLAIVSIALSCPHLFSMYLPQLVRRLVISRGLVFQVTDL